MALLTSISMGMSGCNNDPPEPTPEMYDLQLPAHFPQMPTLDDNPLTVKSVELGRKLFYDPNLSRSGNISCGSCHLQERAFTAPDPLAVGVFGRTAGRNAPTLTNVGYVLNLNWDGGVHRLENHVSVPVQAHEEMDMTFDEIVAYLKSDAEYVQLFKDAYESEPGTQTLIRAISNFERTMISGRSKFDEFWVNKDSSIFTASEMRGLRLFNSEKYECFHCHTEPFFTDENFHNNGLFADYPDKGRYNITNRERDKGKFRTPTLRNIELTAPYMHDGHLATLEDVVDHYAKDNVFHPNKSLFVREIDNPTEQEKQDIVAFLKTLTDYEFVNDERLSDPNQ